MIRQSDPPVDDCPVNPHGEHCECYYEHSDGECCHCGAFRDIDEEDDEDFPWYD